MCEGAEWVDDEEWCGENKYTLKVERKSRRRGSEVELKQGVHSIAGPRHASKVPHRRRPWPDGGRGLPGTMLTEYNRRSRAFHSFCSGDAGSAGSAGPGSCSFDIAGGFDPRLCYPADVSDGPRDSPTMASASATASPFTPNGPRRISRLPRDALLGPIRRRTRQEMWRRWGWPGDSRWRSDAR